ncbi:MAG: hypothetical protein ACIAQZ_09930 [Sedimentisphaeraceae bacterium JB056]
MCIKRNYMLLVMALLFQITVVNAAITGTYVDASASNTAAIDDTTPWYNTTDGSGALWHIRTGSWGVESGTILEGFWNDYDLVTTISGLTSGKTYDIRIVYFGHTSQVWSLGATLDSTADPQVVTAAVASNSDLTGGYATGVGPQYEYLVGSAVADISGKIDVYIAARGDRTWYDGLSYVEVTEPDPSFELGFYESGSYTRVKDDADADVVMNYYGPSNSFTYLNACQAKGLKVMVQIPPAAVEDADLADIETFVTGLQTNGEDHPAILAWYLYDEPDGHDVSAANCEAAYDKIRSLSSLPIALTFIYYPWHCKVQEYHEAFDIMLFDEYPYPVQTAYGSMDFWRSNTNSSWMAVTAGHGSVLNNYGRDFIPIQQSLGRQSGTSSGDLYYDLRLPSLSEADAMANFSILNGADSLIWFTYYRALSSVALGGSYPYAYDGSSWLDDVFAPIETAFDDIGDALAGGEILGGIKEVEDDRIVAKVYYDPSRNKPIIIAQNVSDQTLTNARFYHNLDTSYTRANRIGASEDSSEYVWVYSNGLIQDTFSPFQVHTYDLNWTTGEPVIKSTTPALACNLELDVTHSGYYFTFSVTNNSNSDASIEKIVLWCHGYKIFDLFANTSDYTVTPSGLHDNNANYSNYAVLDFGSGLAAGYTATGLSGNDMDYLGQHGLMATVYYSNGYSLQGVFRNIMDTDDGHRDRMLLELTNVYDVRVEVDPYDQYDDYRLRVYNNSDSVKIQRVVIEADSKIFDTANSGSIFTTTPGPAANGNNDNNLAKVLYLDPSGDGLEPGQSDDWSGGDIDGAITGLKATVYFSDGAKVSGIMTNVPDSDDNNTARYVFEN